MARQINVTFTPEQADTAFKRLQGALRSGKLYQGRPQDVYFGQPELSGLPDGQGGTRSTHHQALAVEFMLMHSEVVTAAPAGAQCVYAFKHGPTRNYLFCTMRGQYGAFVPITSEPFMRGEFGNPDASN